MPEENYPLALPSAATAGGDASDPFFDPHYLARHQRVIRTRPWRAVEAQRQIVTRKLVDNLAEHEVLEAILEHSKPPAREAAPGLHYLLYTPFRYPPLRHGSRFGSRFEQGIWYGALRISTVLAEVAYYRLRFLAASTADLGTVHADFTLFQVAVNTGQGLDLSRPPFTEQQAALRHPLSYIYTQALGQAMRQAGVVAFKFCSARDPRHGPNIGLFNTAAFAAKRPLQTATWHSVTRTTGVEFRHSIQGISRWFAREDVAAQGFMSHS